MSKPHRCSDCKHRPGPRATTNMAKADKAHGIQAKKAPCGCECHTDLAQATWENEGGAVD